MKPGLVNVRLDAARMRKVKELRTRGVSLSDLTREAIDRRYDQLVGATSKSEVAALRRKLFAEFPDPPGTPNRSYSVHDAAQARAAIVRHLEARHRAATMTSTTPRKRSAKRS
jgi:hypothetical protein